MAYKFFNHRVNIRSDNAAIDADTGEFLGWAPILSDGERYLCGDRHKGPLIKVD